MDKTINTDPKDAIATVRGIAIAYRMKQISYEEGRKLAQPYIAIANAKMLEIAKKYNKKPRLFTWESIYK